MLFTSHYTGIIDADKTTIVDSHNSYRAGVVPTAVLMYKMVSIFSTGIKHCVTNFSYPGKPVLKICNLISIFVLWTGILHSN